MCDVSGAGDKQPNMEKDCSEAGAESNRDSGYGPSTSTQQSSTTSSFSRGCFSAEDSHRSSGSETSSSMGKGRGRLALAPLAVQQPSGGPQLSVSFDKCSRQRTSGAADSDLTSSEDKSTEDSSQAAIQKSAYKHVMSYVRKIVDWEKGRGTDTSSPVPACPAEKEEDSGGTSAEDSEPPARLEVLVSLRKGTVVKTSSSMMELLGYPADMWVGRSFIDYVYPKDRASFTSSISSMGVDVDGLLSDKDGSGSCQLFCRLRHYRGIKSVGFNVVSHAHIYKPFQMRIIFHDVKLELNGEGPCILVVADVLNSAYKNTPDGIHPGFRNVVFSMRHTAQCRVDQYDSQGIALLGFLPQDVVGRSMVDFFHPEDLPAIKDVYRKVTQRTGMPFRSRPYRLRTHNGCYVGMETDWSCFINPWSNRIEAVICKHRVIKAPKNINVFEEDEEEASECAEKQMLRKSHRGDIENILSKSLPAADTKVSHMAQRRRRLMALMENLITDLEETVDQPATPDQDHTSVPGDVSPHTSERGSPAPVSVTLPNYIQLNYKETINRFFQSHPKTTIGSSDESDSRNESGGAMGQSSGRRAGTWSVRDPALPGTSGHSAVCGGPRHSAAPPSYHHQPLTQAMLDRHNADMEKNMRQSLGPMKHVGHDSKGKLVKRNNCSEPKKQDLDEFEQERRRAMTNTPAWPAPSIFWPPFSASYTATAPPPGTGGGWGHWLGGPSQVPAAAASRGGGRQQPSLSVLHSVFKPMFLGPVPGALCQQQPLVASLRPPPHHALPSTAGAIRPVAGATRKRANPTPLSGPGGVSSGEQSADCTVTTSESLQKMNLDSDEDMTSKDKRGSDLTFSDSSLSSALKDVDGGGDGSSSGWLNASVGKNNATSEMDQTGYYDQPGPSSSRPAERQPVLMDPPWLMAVRQSCELTNQYQMEPRNMQEVLEQDRQALTRMTQPATLTAQLNQLYQDMETSGVPSVFNLEERDATSGSSDESTAMVGKRMKRCRRAREYDRLTIVFEEDSPIPPPDLPTTYHREVVPTANC